MEGQACEREQDLEHGTKVGLEHGAMAEQAEQGAMAEQAEQGAMAEQAEQGAMAERGAMAEQALARQA